MFDYSHSRSRSGKVILENESRGISPIVELRQLQPVNCEHMMAM